MKNKFLVGGAVRDALLGRPSADEDFVVVGCTTAEMLDLGFTQVGADFPVFLDEKGNEHALARTERSTASSKNRNSRTFEVKTKNVTLKEDLSRRDLTINAMAQSTEDGELFDFFGGQQDLNNKLLRHVSTAFSEDPVRVLRVARFAARFNFRVHPSTMKLMTQMVNDGMIDNLVTERVTMEMTKAFKTKSPSTFFKVLDSCGALAVLFPELEALKGKTQPPQHHPEGDAFVHTLLVLDEATATSDDVAVRFAALVHDLGKGTTPIDKLPSHHQHEKRGVKLVEQMCQRLKLPSEWKSLGMLSSKSHLKFHTFDEMTPSAMVRWFVDDDAFRRTARFKNMLLVSLCDENGRGDTKPKVGFSRVQNVLDMLNACSTVDTMSLTERGLKGQAFGNAIRQSRVQMLKLFMAQ